jgi:putative heme-binding domain-containing protein
VAETTTNLTIRQAGGIDTVVSRDKLKRIDAQGRSLMPEGVESGLSHQDFADLLEYLTTAK